MGDIIIIGVQPLGRSGQRPELSQASESESESVSLWTGREAV